jgi:ATP-binding cassette subfamily C protein
VTGLPVADLATVRRAASDLIGRDRRAVAVILVLHVAAAVAGLAAPWLLGIIVDNVVPAPARSTGWR